jgi:hypothetical protein
MNGPVIKCVPGASRKKQQEAVDAIVKNFKWLFTKKGKRRQFGVSL